MKEVMQRHMIVRLLKTSDKKRILKESEKKVVLQTVEQR